MFSFFSLERKRPHCHHCEGIDAMVSFSPVLCLNTWSDWFLNVLGLVQNRQGGSGVMIDFGKIKASH